MSFINPSALWLLSLLSIPIIIHLVSFRKARKVHFSNISFLREVSVQQKSRSRLWKLLVLLMRCLAIIFLVVAFARPYFETDLTSLTSSSSLTYLDNSWSMERPAPDGSPLLYTATSLAKDIVSDPSTKNLRYMDNSTTQVISSKEAFDDITIAYAAASRPPESISDKSRLYESQQTHIISDFQKSIWGNLEPILQDTAHSYFFHYLTSSPVTNVYADTVYLEKALGLIGGNTIIIRLHSDDPEAKVLVRLEREGTQLLSKSIQFEANQAEIRIPVAIPGELFGTYILALNDQPISFDNEFYFNIPRPSTPQVALLVDEGGRSTLDYWQKVFANETYFSASTQDLDNPDYDRVSQADILVLISPKKIPQWLTSNKSNYGAILVAPDRDTDLLSLSGFVGTAIQREAGQSSAVSSDALNSSLFSGVLARSNRDVSLPKATPSLRPSGYYETILKLQSTRPWLTKTGNTYTFMSPVSDDYTDLHKHSLFLPLIYQIARQGSQTALYHRLEDPVATMGAGNLKQLQTGEQIIKLRSNETELIVDYRVQGNQLVINMPPELTVPGIYEILSADETIAKLAFNYTKQESMVEQLSKRELAKAISGYDHIKLEVINDVSASQYSKEAREATPIWKYALALALVFLIIESLILRFSR